MWPDWNDRLEVGEKNEKETRKALRKLARYANPVMLGQLGVTLGAARLPGGPYVDAPPVEVARKLRARLRTNRPGSTVGPFRPSGSRGQIIRTAAELRAGMGTCIDFAVSVAAGCVVEKIPVLLAVLKLPGEPSHAFLAVRPDGRQSRDTMRTFTTRTAHGFLHDLVDTGRLAIIDP